jgi:hypothetical protein
MKSHAASTSGYGSVTGYEEPGLAHGTRSTAPQRDAHALSGHYNDTRVQVVAASTQGSTMPRAAHRTPWQTGRARLGRLARQLGLLNGRSARLPASTVTPREPHTPAQAQLRNLAAMIGQGEQQHGAAGYVAGGLASGDTPQTRTTLRDLFAADPFTPAVARPHVTLAELLAAGSPSSSGAASPRSVEPQTSQSEIQPYSPARAAGSSAGRPVPSHSEHSSGPERQDQLKGKSIDPHVALQHLDHVDFDGIGRIQSFKTPDVPAHVLDALEAAQTVPLTHVNAPHPREVAKTERDSLVQFMALLRKVPGEAARALFDEGKAIWLSGDVSSGVAADYFRRAASETRHLPGVHALAENLLKQTESEKTLPQYHENLYGRKFDSEIAHALIHNPPPAMLESTRAVAKALIERFEPLFASLNDTEHLDFLDGIHKWVDDDVRPWFSHTPEIHAFLENPSFEALLNALRKVDTGIDVLKVNFLAVQLSMLGRHTASKDWMAFADANYHTAVIPQRSTYAMDHDVKTQSYGIRLHYQPEYEPTPQFGQGKSWADARTPDFEMLTAFEDMAVSTGHPIVNGASGSTNIMAFMLRHLAQTDPSFDANSALLGTMSFLVFDGGHSFNEAMTVADAIRTHPGTTDPHDLDASMERSDMMSDYALQYHDLARLGERGTIEHVLDTALSKTLDYFDAHSHYAQQNQHIADGLHS